MLVDGQRALAYIVAVDDVKPIEGYDRVEQAVVGGWHCIVGKGMKAGDKAVYFEIDSLVPAEDERFAFMEKRKYRVKTQKMCGTLSQGLLMPLTDFPELIDMNVGEDVTEKLGIKYYEPEDNERKARTVDPNAKYKSMAARHQKFFKTKIARWLMRRQWGKKLLFALFGKKKDKPLGFPTKFAYVHKTDEDRCENMPWILEDKELWIKTTKIDGTSATYILERLPEPSLWQKLTGKADSKYEYYVCSRNIRQLDENQPCYHEENVYWKANDKFKIREALEDLMDTNKDLQYICLQGEIAGPNVQGNPHKFDDLRFFGFNLIDSKHGRWNSVEASRIVSYYKIPWVPIVQQNYVLPDTMEELKAQADGPCEAEGASGLREGYVYRSIDGQRSFKNVSNKYLLKKGQ